MMGGMDDLVTFLRARLDEDAATAQAASPGPWRVDDESFAEAIYGPGDGPGVGDMPVVAGGRWGGEAPVFETNADAIHIARHDPARALRQVRAARQVLDEYDGARQAKAADPGDVSAAVALLAFGIALRALATAYDAHPDYREEWRP